MRKNSVAQEKKEIIVIAAFSCGRNFGSEEQVGWQAVEMAMGRFEVHVFCDVRSQSRFTDQDLQELGEQDVYFHFVRGNVALEKLAKTVSIIRNLYHQSWHLRLAQEVREKIDVERIKIAHHASWARFGVASSLTGLKVPLVVGPVGGGDFVPGRFLGGFPLKGRITALLKRVFLFSTRFNPRLRRSLRSTTLILAATPATLKYLQKITKETPCELESLLSIDKVSQQRCQTSSRKLVTSGRLIGWKGFWMVIEAFFQADDYWEELIVAGDGSDRKELEDLADKLSRPGKRVTFTGQLPKGELESLTRSAAVYCFGSLQDSGGFSVLEAMAEGLPVVCLDAGGPAVVVDESSGIKIPVTDPKTVIAEMSRALNLLADNQPLMEKLSDGALERARSLSLERLKVKRQKRYEHLLSGDLER